MWKIMKTKKLWRWKILKLKIYVLKNFETENSRDGPFWINLF